MGHGLTDVEIEKMAREIEVSPRSIVRVLAGLEVRGLSGRRIVRTLDSRGLLPRSAPDTATGSVIGGAR